MNKDQFKAVRKGLKLTQKTCAELLHMHWRSIQNMEHGLQPILPSTAELFSIKALEIHKERKAEKEYQDRKKARDYENYVVVNKKTN